MEVGTLYTMSDVAKILGVSTRTVIRRINAGEIVAYKMGNTTRIRQEDFEAYCNQHRVEDE